MYNHKAENMTASKLRCGKPANPKNKKAKAAQSCQILANKTPLKGTRSMRP